MLQLLKAANHEKIMNGKDPDVKGEVVEIQKAASHETELHGPKQMDMPVERRLQLDHGPLTVAAASALAHDVDVDSTGVGVVLPDLERQFGAGLETGQTPDGGLRKRRRSDNDAEEGPDDDGG